MKKHYLLALLLHPLLAPAQAGPPVNLRVGQVVRMQAADVPVDVAVINTSQQSRQPGFVVAAQGSNLLAYYISYGNGTFGMNINTTPAVAPLSILPLPQGPSILGYAVDNVLVLTLDGNVTTWRGNSFGQAGTPFQIRPGQTCAPTDRLLAGRFAPNSRGNDLLCWSDGPRPGLVSPVGMALHLGNGAYQAFAGTPPALPSVTGTAGVRLATASLNFLPTVGTDPEALFAAQPDNPVGECQFWENQNITSGQVRKWWSTNQRTFAVPGGPCVGVAVGAVDGRVAPGPGQGQSAMDCVFLSSVITLRYGSGQGQFNSSYYLSPLTPPETYPVLFVPREVRLADLTGDQRPEMLVLGDDGTLNVFDNITLVPGHTTAFNPIPYTFATGPDPAILRLGDLDADGDLDVLVPCRGDHTVRLFINDRLRLGTAPATMALALAMYPTPATSALTVRWAAPGGGTAPAAVALLDALGRTVRAWPAVAPGTTLDVAGLARGVYALRVQGAAGRATRRVVLE